MSTNKKFTNRLINAKSPYLLQHAHNPVDWFAWGEEAFEKARNENKPLLISIGYSACHWCHVMEHESFEDEEVAELMNRFFVNVKVDREERPDVDHMYMSAVQLMTGRGGWPLNCFVLPDGRPIYGGTYFPKPSWKNILNKLHDLFTNDYREVLDYAEKLTEGIQKMELFKLDSPQSKWNLALLKDGVTNWKKFLDYEEGGPDKAPKFPLPSNYLFLLRYAQLLDDSEVLAHVHLTLQKMAMGGIFDRLGGGFARYSVDALWKIPHFEKMLYDNAQLISLYSEAYLNQALSRYKDTVERTVNWLLTEMWNNEGYFYSALDADSEGVEGKFYVWSYDELQQFLSDDEFQLIESTYAFKHFSHWEHGNYVLHQRESEAQIATQLNLSIEEFTQLRHRAEHKMLEARSQRIRPGLDDKMLTAWNAMTVKGLVDASIAFDRSDWFGKAEQCYNFLLERAQLNGKLSHCYKNGEAYGTGLLDDYVHMIEASISLFQASSNEKYIADAQNLLQIAFEDFAIEGTDLLSFSPTSQTDILVKHIETSDNVIPASNSVLANQLYVLSKITGHTEWQERAFKMLETVSNEWSNYPQGYSHWAILALHQILGSDEVVITGPNAQSAWKTAVKNYNPGRFYFYSEQNSDLSLFKDRFNASEIKYYRCFEQSCSLPVNSLDELN